VGLGFTLVELLVVIGIIALLVGILLPVLGKAKERANATKCEANMKTLMTAFIMFSNDHKGSLPGNRANEGDPIDWHRDFLYGGYAWSNNFDKAPQNGTIWPYIKRYEVYRCPSLQGGFARVGSSQETNSRFDVACYPLWRGAKITKIKNLSHFTYSGGGKNYNIWQATPIIVQEAPLNQNSGSWKEGNHSESDYMAVVHNKGSYYGAVDGSVQFFAHPPGSNSTNWETKGPSGRMIVMGHDYEVGGGAREWGVFNSM
jgi:prepilin-type N-terminal cleavage/methylation domain-containing protein